MQYVKKLDVYIDVVLLCLGQDTQAVCAKTLEQQQLQRVSKVFSLLLLAVSFLSVVVSRLLNIVQI